MKKGPWQSRSRHCKQVASPEGKEARVRKPYKKPRQVTIRETQDGDSEGPTQLGVGETLDNTKLTFVHRKDNSEWGKTMEKKLEDMEKRKAFGSHGNVPLCQSPPSLKSVSDSSDSEGDDVPISATIRAVKDKVETVMPEGEGAVGAGIARDFGKDLGVFKGQVAHVEAGRRRHVYHVKYDDGDSEDFDAEEYRYAYELRQALDNGTHVPASIENENELDGLSSDDGLSSVNVASSKRKRVKRGSGDASKEPKKRKTLGKMEPKTYTTDTILEDYAPESEYGMALREMSPAELKQAVEKLNKSAAKGIKGTVKEKLLTSKYANTCVEKLKAHLVAQRVAQNDMFRKAAPAKKIPLGNAAAVSVGDWVEVDGDRSPGWNSEGGIAMVIASSQICAEVK